MLNHFFGFDCFSIYSYCISVKTTADIFGKNIYLTFTRMAYFRCFYYCSNNIHKDHPGTIECFRDRSCKLLLCSLQMDLEHLD